MAVKTGPRPSPNRLFGQPLDTSGAIAYVTEGSVLSTGYLSRPSVDVFSVLSSGSYCIGLNDVSGSNLVAPTGVRVNPLGLGCSEVNTSPLWSTTPQDVDDADLRISLIGVGAAEARLMLGYCSDPIADTGGAFELRHSREDLYDGLGRRRGTAGDRDAILAAWKLEGAAGASWLCERLREETDVERQADAEEALITIGAPAIPAILDCLVAAPSAFQAEALLHALRWLGITEDQQPRTRRALRSVALHKAPDVRLAACKAARVLPTDPALQLWQSMLIDEDDPDVRAEIAELRQEAHA